VADWDKLTGSGAYGPAELARSLAAPVSWQAPVPAYLDSLAYTFQWLGDYLGHRAPRQLLTIVIGDHQPLASVSGAGASWDVPVHIISADAGLLRRFEARGFRPGLLPAPGPAATRMHALTPLLLAAFDGSRTGLLGMAE
jgi:hypothetical protein